MHTKKKVMSKVYFTDLHTNSEVSLLDKLQRLMKKAGFETISLKEQFTAIKIHFGEPGNLAFLRPNWSKVVVDYVKKMGGKPFLTDSNTLYSGRRDNALDHLEAAYENGYSPFSTDTHIIIADGIKGLDYREIEINGDFCKTAKIGAAIADADVIISMSHFKGHEMTGFGGALKNLGMGSASIMGKMELHSTSTPRVREENCVGCGKCEANCNHHAIRLNASGKAHIDETLCVGCGQCIAVCRFDAARVNWKTSLDDLCCRVAEYAKAAVLNKPQFHINFLMNISPFCDCVPSNDLPIVPDIGILASFDPVALDKASVDLVTQNSPHHHEKDAFCSLHAETNGQIALQHGEKIDLGTMQYELEKI